MADISYELAEDLSPKFPSSTCCADTAAILHQFKLIQVSADPVLSSFSILAVHLYFFLVLAARVTWQLREMANWQSSEKQILTKTEKL